MIPMLTLPVPEVGSGEGAVAKVASRSEPSKKRVGAIEVLFVSEPSMMTLLESTIAPTV